MITSLTEPQAIALALALPLLACAIVLCWATVLRRRGRFEGLPGRLHGLGIYFDSVRMRELALDVAALGSATVVTLFSFIWVVIWLALAEVRMALLLAVATALAATLGTLLKKATRRLRPGAAAATFFGSSFPSSHTLMGSTLYGSAAWLAAVHLGWPAAGAWLLGMACLLAVLIGISRVVLRVHYLSDVVAGWLVAASLVVAVALMSRF